MLRTGGDLSTTDGRLSGTVAGNAERNRQALLTCAGTTIVRGGASVWVRLHRQTQIFPERMFAMTAESDEIALEGLAAELEMEMRQSQRPGGQLVCPDHVDPLTQAVVTEFGGRAEDILSLTPVLKRVESKAQLGIFRPVGHKQ